MFIDFCTDVPNYRPTNYGVPMSTYGMGPYGSYGTVPAAGPTVVVNVPGKYLLS